MRRVALLVTIALLAPLLTPAASLAGRYTTDVYRSHFLAVDRAGRAYAIDALVEDRPAGGRLVLEVRRRCGGCRADVYSKALKPGDVVVRQPSPNAECQCMGASVTARFGGKEMRLDWVWDLEQGGRPSDGGYEWDAVTANNVLNVGCFGTGSATSTPDPFSGDVPDPPPGARPFPRKMPRQFKVDILARPGCYAERP